MAESIQSPSKKIRLWIRSHVYRVYFFRVFFEKERQKNLSPEEGKSVTRKKELLYKKIEEHTKRGQDLQLSEAAIKNLNSVIVEMIRKGKKPKEIIDEFEKESQSNGPSIIRQT